MKPIANLWLRKKVASLDSAEKTHDIAPPEAGGFKVGRLMEPPSKQPQDEIALTLGDFLPRIAVRFLKHGEHDGNREVRFKIGELSDMIAKRKTKIPIARIAEAFPDIFRDEDGDFQGQEIYFPWRKLADMMERIRPSAAGEEKEADAFDTLVGDVRAPIKHTRPITVFAGHKAAPKSKPPAQPVPNIQPGDLLKRQRDLAVQQRDQALSKLKSLEERMQRQISLLAAERDLAISEKADALAFIAIFSSLAVADSPN